MGIAALQPQSAAASTSWKSATIMLPSPSPPQASCTATVSLRCQSSDKLTCTVRSMPSDDKLHLAAFGMMPLYVMIYTEQALDRRVQCNCRSGT